MVVYDKDSHPHLHRVMRTALAHSGIELRSPTISGGPLTKQQLRCVEQFLHVKSMRYSLEREIEKWCAGKERSIFMPFSDAAEIMNGQDPEADLGLLVHMAMEGDL